MQIDYKAAKAICSASEFSLLEEARPKSLTQFSAAELKKKVTRARKLADKWRDQAKSQGRSAKGSGARSAEKHELFKEALARFEARLAKTEATPKAVTKKTASKRSATKKQAKKQAKKTATKSTASTGKKVGAKKSAAKKVSGKKVAAKKAAAKKATAKKGPAAKGSLVNGLVIPQVGEMPKMPVARRRSRKSLEPDHKARAEQHARRSAQRIAASGLSTRVRGHVSSQGRRNQAARSARKRE